MKRAIPLLAALAMSPVSHAEEVDTLATLRAAYPTIEFTSGFPKEEGFPDQAISENTAHVVNQWLRDKPGIERLMPEIQLYQGTGASVGIGYELGHKPYFLGEPTHSIAVGSKSILPVKDALRDLSEPGMTLDHEFVHVQDNIVDVADMRLVYEGKAKESETLRQKYIDLAVEAAEKLYKDPEFLKLLGKIGDVGYRRDIIENVASAEEDFTYQTADVRRASILSDIGIGLEVSDDPLAPALLEKWNAYLAEHTGLYSYSFRGKDFKELSTTYGELSTERARTNKELAQLEFDRAMSVDAPQWLKDQAEERYYNIMGDYCEENTCGPCLSYTLTCSVD